MTNRVLAALDGYATEGGYDVSGGLATCYSPVVALGRVEGPGEARGLWPDFAGVVEAARQAGTGLRITPEWTRVEPRPGEVNRGALETYAALVSRARTAGLEVTVCLVDAVWPAWCGQEAWLLPWVVDALFEHAHRVAEAIPEVPIVVMADAARLIDGGFLESLLPPWRRRASREADYAHHHMGQLLERLRATPLGGRLVGNWRTVSPAAFRAGDAGGGVDEIHVTSLLAGAGPTSARGLFEIIDGEWVPTDARR